MTNVRFGGRLFGEPERMRVDPETAVNLPHAIISDDYPSIAIVLFHEPVDHVQPAFPPFPQHGL
jgi:hypothetical protein